MMVMVLMREIGRALGVGKEGEEEEVGRCGAGKKADGDGCVLLLGHLLLPRAQLGLAKIGA